MSETNGNRYFEEALREVPQPEQWAVRRAARFLTSRGRKFLVHFGVLNARAEAERVGRSEKP